MINKFCNKTNKAWLFLTLFLSVFCHPSMAGTALPDQIIDLIKKQKTAQAYLLANENLDAFEGYPQFDLAFALAARAVGEYHQAIFAFERVLFVKPDSIDARFGLAITYYDLKNFKAANTELSLLLKYKLSVQLSETVKQYIDVIESRVLEAEGYWQHSVRAGLGSDSNANNGSTEEFITVPVLGLVRLFDRSREVSSAFYDIEAQTLYVKPTTQLSKWYISSSILHVAFSDQLALSRTFASFFTGYQTRIKNGNVNVNIFYRPLWLNSDNFLEYYGTKFGLTRTVWHDNTLGIDYSYSIGDYSQKKLLNKQQSLIEAWLDRPFDTGSQRFTLRLAKEEATQSPNNLSGRSFWGVGYSFQQSINSLWNYKASIDYLDGEYSSPDNVFNIVRDDNFISAEFELGYQYNTHWRLLSKINYLNNRSNLPLYDFSRYKFWLGGQYNFY